MIAVGSSLRVSKVDRAVTPNPVWHKYFTRSLQTITYERGIIHAEDNNALVLWRIFRYPSQMRFYDVVPVQEWHLAICLDLIFGVLCKVIQAGNVKLELAAFAKFTETSS